MFADNRACKTCKCEMKCAINVVIYRKKELVCKLSMWLVLVMSFEQRQGCLKSLCGQIG